jgi:hypothetical protein
VRAGDGSPRAVAAAHEAAAALRAANITSEVTPGDATKASHTLGVADGKYTLESNGERRDLRSIDEVIRALEGAR